MSEAYKIKSIITEMIYMLNCCDYEDFTAELIFFMDYIDQDYNDCLYKIRTIYGGMASFNDVVLYKNGELLKSESDAFQLLRIKLFELSFYGNRDK